MHVFSGVHVISCSGICLQISEPKVANSIQQYTAHHRLVPILVNFWMVSILHASGLGIRMHVDF